MESAIPKRILEISANNDNGSISFKQNELRFKKDVTSFFVSLSRLSLAQGAFRSLNTYIAALYSACYVKFCLKLSHASRRKTRIYCKSLVMKYGYLLAYIDALLCNLNIARKDNSSLWCSTFIQLSGKLRGDVDTSSWRGWKSRTLLQCYLRSLAGTFLLVLRRQMISHLKYFCHSCNCCCPRAGRVKNCKLRRNI